MANLSIITGRFTADPELRTTQSGKTVTSFTIAVYAGKDSEPYWIDCTAWEETANKICQFFSKGKQIYIEGELVTRSYEDSNGKRQKSTSINVRRWEFMGTKDDAAQAPAEKPQTFINPVIDVPDDDLPF